MKKKMTGNNSDEHEIIHGSKIEYRYIKPHHFPLRNDGVPHVFHGSSFYFHHVSIKRHRERRGRRRLDDEIFEFPQGESTLYCPRLVSTDPPKSVPPHVRVAGREI